MLIALVSAGLFALAQPPWDFWPLAGVALVPWLVVVGRARAGEALLVSFAVGTGAACASATWVPEALRGLGASPVHAGLGFVAAGAWAHGVSFAVVGALVHGARHLSPAVRIAVVALTFIAIDALQLAGWWSIPWALLGHSQGASAGVSQLAVVGGVPWLSALLAAINQAAALAWESRGERSAVRRLAALLAAWGALAAFGLPLAKGLRAMTGGPSGPVLRWLLVQPDIPRGERWAEELQGKHLARMVEASELALAATGKAPDAILWPENLLTTPVDRSAPLGAALRSAVDRLGVPVILGAVRGAQASDPDLYRSSVLWIEPGRGIVAVLDKERGVPLLEALPRSRAAALAARLLGAAGDGKRVEEAAHPEGSLQARPSVAPVLCYEALFPDIVVARRSPESAAILNLADDGWVESEVATHQLLAFARLRAIEQRLALVRVAHGGLSAVVDPYGQTALELPLDRWAHGLAEVRAEPPPASMERIALLALPLATGAGVGWLLGPWVRRGARSGAARVDRSSGGGAHA
jgi:apolipoprotein N-acyltransferase